MMEGFGLVKRWRVLAFDIPDYTQDCSIMMEGLGSAPGAASAEPTSGPELSEGMEVDPTSPPHREEPLMSDWHSEDVLDLHPVECDVPLPVGEVEAEATAETLMPDPSTNMVVKTKGLEYTTAKGTPISERKQYHAMYDVRYYTAALVIIECMQRVNRIMTQHHRLLLDMYFTCGIHKLSLLGYRGLSIRASG